MKKCIICSKRGKYTFKDDKQFFYLCKKCYNNLSNENKLSIQCCSGSEKAPNSSMGFCIGGLMGYWGWKQ